MEVDILRIAMFIDERCLPSWGGGYSYYKTLVEAINAYYFGPELDIVNIVFSRKAIRQLHFSKPVVPVKTNPLSSICYELMELAFRSLSRLGADRFGGIFLKAMWRIRNRCTVVTLKKENIDLVYYVSPNWHNMDYPFIATHWDVGHKSMHSFPEVTSNGNYEKREDYYLRILNKAFLILCESRSGANELLRYYPINPEKVQVLPIFSGEVVNQQVPEEDQKEIIASYHLQAESYFVYPAQFWAHKNHYNLVRAFHLLFKETGNRSLKLILCGGDKGNRNYIRDVISNLGLENNVLLPGFISNEHLYALYKSAVALVMPTFLGPTNMPLLEAAQLGCPVICSSLKGHEEIMGNAALYFDPADVDDIKGCMHQVLNADLRAELIRSAYHQMCKSGFSIDNSVLQLHDILLKVKPIRKAWGI